jgi:transcription-repair coupling factor (superfamily II helicase)
MIIFATDDNMLYVVYSEGITSNYFCNENIPTIDKTLKELIPEIEIFIEHGQMFSKCFAKFKNIEDECFFKVLISNGIEI